MFTESRLNLDTNTLLRIRLFLSAVLHKHSGKRGKALKTIVSDQQSLFELS